MWLGRSVPRSLAVGAAALGLAAAGTAPAAAHAWSLGVDDATMAWSLALTAEALDMLSAAGIEAARGDDQTGNEPLPDDPANVVEARDSPAISVRAKALLAQVGLDIYPVDGPDPAALVLAFRFDVTAGQGAADDAGWHEAISFGPRCAGCAGETDTTLDLLADFALPAVAAPED